MTETTAAGAGAGAYATVGPLRMWYDDRGQGSPVVLLHGGLMTVDATFGSAVGRLAGRHRVIAVELQAHGHTPDIDREFSLDHLADDVVGPLAALGVERATFVGFSLGGMVGLALAMRHPGLRAGWFWRRCPTGATEGFRAGARDPDAFDAIAERLSAMVGAYAGWSEDDMRSLAVPTMVLVGDHDFVRTDHAVAMQELIPGAQLAVLPGATHMEVTRRQDQLVALLDPFLDAVAAG
jgi:pimeloyl-ACP methyl ester carboxylesterase